MGLTTPHTAAVLMGDSSTAVPVPARPDPRHERVLADPELLGDIASAVGGPFHVLYPDRMAQHIREFRAAFDRAEVGGAVYFAKKANKAAAFARTAAEHDAGVDVSSVGELTAALACGVRGTDLMVTGPAKSDDLLWLAARHGALVTVDSLDELERLILWSDRAIVTWILLRVRPPASSSRFGLTEEELSRALYRIDPSGALSLEGFSFHLGGYDPAPRATLAAALVERCRAARALGHSASTISIGGGFGVDYVDGADWARFTEAASPRWFHAGHRVEQWYPYHCRCPGAQMLTAILDTACLARRLRDNGIRLVVEPGRALLDQAGCTVFRVQGVKPRTADGPDDQPYLVVTVDGTSFSLSEQWFASEYLPDPVLWPQATPHHAAHGPMPACVAGASCLESDMLSWRRVPLARPARVGDLLVYPNTAGYQMDSNESPFHELPLPPKVVVSETPTRLRWALDR